jgi:hypothetical protein
VRRAPGRSLWKLTQVAVLGAALFCPGPQKPLVLTLVVLLDLIIAATVAPSRASDATQGVKPRALFLRGREDGVLVLASLLFPLATKLVVGAILCLAFTREAVWPVMKIAARQTVLLAERSKPGFASFASDFDAHLRARPDVYLNLLLMGLLM